MEVNGYFGPIRTNIPHTTQKYGPVKYKSEVDYYKQIYCSPEKLARTRKKWKKQFKK